MTQDLEADIVSYFAEREREQGCVRHHELARYLAGELDSLRAHVESCADCRGLIDALKVTETGWHAPATLSAPIPFPRMIRLVAAPVLALAAGLVLFVFTRGTPPDDRLTPKGAATWSLEVAVQRGGQQFLAPSGAALQTGDQLGLFYTAPTDGYLTVLYADAHSEPTRIFPARAPDSAKVTAGSNLPLKDGAVLGEGSGCEWVVGVFTAAPLPASRATELVRQMVAARRGCALGEAPEDAHAQTRVVVVNR